MGFNFGAFAGGLAKGAMDTYTTLSEVELKKKREEREQAEYEAKQLERAQQAEAGRLLAQASQERGVAGTGVQGPQALSGLTGTQAGAAPEAAQMTPEGRAALYESLKGLSPEQAQQALRAYGAAYGQPTEGGLDLSRASTYRGAGGELGVTNQSAMPTNLESARRFQELAAQSGNLVAVEKATANRAQALQIAGGERAEKRSQAEDDFAEWHQNTLKLAAENPLKAAEALKNEYNTGAAHKDGITATITKDAKGNSYLVRMNDKTNKVVDSTIITPETLAEGIKGMAAQKYFALAGNFGKGIEFDLKSREVGVRERELAEKVKVGLFKAQANQANAAASASSAHASVYQNMLRLANDNRAAGEAMKPFIDDFKNLTPEDQAGAKGQSILLQAATAAARKTNDVTGIISALKKPDADTKITVNPDGTVIKGGMLYVPDPAKPGEYKPAGGLGQSSLDIAIAQKLKGGSSGSTAAAPEVPNRPLYNKTTAELQSMAKKPRGVSSAEANDAQAELEARKGESRMSAIPK